MFDNNSHNVSFIIKENMEVNQLEDNDEVTSTKYTHTIALNILLSLFTFNYFLNYVIQSLNIINQYKKAAGMQKIHYVISVGDASRR